MLRKLKFALFVLLIAGPTLWVLNSSALAPADQKAGLRLLAHRGVHQTYPRDGLTEDTCTATRIHAPTHGFIENTLPSMQAAFEYGAEVVELDVHLTPGGEFAVFHDRRLECRTDGSGVTGAQPMPYLRSLDIGYGYTADGVAHPLRGTGVGLMPTLQEVFEAGLPGRYLINLRGVQAGDGEALARLLQTPAYRAQVFGVYGAETPTRAGLARLPGLRGYDRGVLRTCLLRYILIGWSGRMPPSCRDRIVAVPIDVAPWLWGWPHRFTTRLKVHGSTAILLGPRNDTGFSSGIDTADMLVQVPTQFDGLIWTNRIEVVGPLVAQ